MRATSGRRSAGARAGALVGAALLCGCQTVPFEARPPRPDDAVLGLGAPLPYLRPGLPPAPHRLGAGPGSGSARSADRARDVYAATRGDLLSPVVRRFPQRLYVTNGRDGTVDIVDPGSYSVVGHLRAGVRPRDVAPSWDLKTLWVNDERGGALIPVDPRTGRRGGAVPVTAPHDLYFTADGRHALVLAGAPHRIDVRAPRSMRLRASIPVPCRGLSRADFTADGSYALVGCEASGQLIKIDVHRRTVAAVIDLSRRSGPAAARPAPQEVRLSPDGTVFYVSDPANGGAWVVDTAGFRPTGFVPTGKGAHGLYPSRDGDLLYVTNPEAGTISLVSFASRRVVRTWRPSQPGSPGPGALSADGTVLWLSGRDDDAVYAISTRTGTLIRRIRVGDGPHGLCFYPQPGRYSLGHGLR